MNQRFITITVISALIFTFSLLSSSYAATANNTGICGIDWQWSRPLPQGNHLQNVTYGNGLFVAVGDYGTILTSPDGSTWTMQTSNTVTNLNGIAYGEGEFVAVGDKFILTSPNGITWTITATGYVSYEVVIWADNQFVVGYDMDDIAWNGHQFLMVGSSAIFSSTDLVTWTEVKTDVHLEGITWNGSQWVAVGEGIYISSDGITWTEVKTDVYLLDIAWSGTQFVAVGQNGDIVTSADGVNWISRVSNETDYLTGIVWSGTQFVAVGWHGAIVTSPNGVNWNSLVSDKEPVLSSIIWSGTQFISVGEKILTSPNGIDWLERTQHSGKLNDVTWNDNQFVAVGIKGNILTSADGITWITRNIDDIELSLHAIAGSGSQFVVVGAQGIILTSTDGITWIVRRPGKTAQPDLNDIVWADNQFVAIGDTGNILTSPDGIVWTTRIVDSSKDLHYIIWNGSQFVVISSWCNILTSIDGITWNTHDCGDLRYLGRIIWDDTQFLAISDDILTSQDRITWQHFDKPLSISDISWDGTQLVAVGRQGIITGTYKTIPDAPKAISLYPSYAQYMGDTKLRGRINANCAATNVSFEFGLTPDYGEIIPATPNTIDGYTGNTEVTAGLTCYTPYHYRVVATNSIATTYGQNQAFTIECPSPIAITKAATGITATSAQLNGYVNNKEVDTNVNFELGTTINYGTNIIANPNLIPSSNTDTIKVTANSTNLLCNTTYHYRVKAANIEKTQFGEDHSFTTAACVPSPAIAPTVITHAASSIGADNATLHGAVYDNGAATTVTFELGTTNDYGTNLVATPKIIRAGNGYTWVSSYANNLACNTTYHYRVKAENSAGITYGVDNSVIMQDCEN